MPKPMISFYIPKEQKYLDSETINSISLNDHAFFINSQRAWLVQTYLYLKSSMNNVICSDKLVKDAINIVHCDEMLKLKDHEDFFTVVIVADRRVYLGGNLCIVQNKNQIKSKSDYWIIHWPQANLIKSKRNKQDNKELIIGFLGLEKNSIDIKKVIQKSKYKDKMNIVFRGPGEWNNYEDLDLVVSIRKFSLFKSNEKPATKLLNAWRAGVVFVGGNDSAYEQIGRPEIDYVKVDSPIALVEKLEKLFLDDKLRIKLIKNGYKSSHKYTNEQITWQWKEFIDNVAIIEFKEWKMIGNKNILVYRKRMYYWMKIKRFILTRLGLY